MKKRRKYALRKPAVKKKASSKALSRNKTAAAPPKAAARRDYKALFHRKLTENHLFYEVGRIIASETEPFELIKKIISVINKEVPFEDSAVYTVKKDMTGLDPFYYSGPSFRKALLDTVYYDNGAPGTIASTGESIFLQDAALYEGFLQHPEEHRKPGSYLGIALMNESRVIGVMGFSHPAAPFSGTSWPTSRPPSSWRRLLSSWASLLAFRSASCPRSTGTGPSTGSAGCSVWSGSPPPSSGWGLC